MLDFKKLNFLEVKDLENGIKEPQIIKVPEGIDYMSQWRDFEIPKGHLIIDKSICGCGFTEWCLTNNLPTILLSPRKVLLENKEEQHNTVNKITKRIDYPVYYFRNEYDFTGAGFDEEPTAKGVKQDEVQRKGTASIDQTKRIEYLSNLKTSVQDYIRYCSGTPKILVTYDSAHHIFDSIRSMGGDLSEWSIVVDEMQSIFTDSSYKSDVELRVVNELQTLPNVLYVSATPMLGRYLNFIPYFKGLQYFKLDWGNSRTDVVYIERKLVESVQASVVDWINMYKSGNSPIKSDSLGNIQQSKELVIYLNSVTGICAIIKKAGLKPSEVNIICAQSASNKVKLNKLNTDLGYKKESVEKFDYGKIPTCPENNKMFTFCTKTTYIGADFYSYSAYSIVCSNINIQTLNLDIALDLPQIAGRQRLKENVFKNEITFLQQHNTRSKSVFTDEEFIDHLKNKQKTTEDLILTFKEAPDSRKVSIANRYRKGVDNYKEDFVGFDTNNEPVRNDLIILSELRNYEITRPEYLNKVIVKKEYDQHDSLVFSESISSDSQILDDFIKVFNRYTVFSDKMKCLCDFYSNHRELYISHSKIISGSIPLNYRNYMNILGVEKIKANSYHEGELIKHINDSLVLDEIKDIILSTFKIGSSYALKEIKNTFRDIYNNHGINKSPKAIDIVNYFDVKKCKIPTSGSRVDGYLILNKKEN